MLNISSNKITDKVDHTSYSSLEKVESRKSGKWVKRLITIFFLLLFISMFLPWTQNIRSKGEVTALQPEHRPQSIQSIIAGRIEKWFVMEGDYVEKGDTIMFVSEIKDEYFDPELLNRTREQLNAKEQAVGSYKEKVKALDTRIGALLETNQLKLQQARNKARQARLKVESDSMDYQAAIINYEIAEEQYERILSLYKDGLKSLTDLENRRLNMRKEEAEMTSAQNKLLTSQNEVINAEVELNSIQAQYRDAVAKVESDKYTTLTGMYESQAEITKLENQYTNYSVRQGMYYITAPVNGYITQAIQSGIGENLKEGDRIVSIMPADYELAVEMYVRPIDLPLLQKGQEVRVQFDGWPAIVFSGWPEQSYGTYGGEIFAIDRFITKNGKYRVLVAPDPEQPDWPEALRLGAGTSNMVLLKDVPVWYELWRNINGFPPDFYAPLKEEHNKEKK
ncbi:MAG TPA: HlyD family efflux transporter periplasmic adaptor subunit [Salegentibacter sp.]|uniref:HlyD family secretion protein n=1 Tax=Salegentibacter sp. TaxID=1903072 RepID=UPI002F934A1E